MNYNIALCRNLAIISIILHHTLCAFGSWPPNHKIDVPLPDILSILSYDLKAVGLGTFTFVSGYLMFFQEKKKISFTNFLYKKTSRILLPCLLYALAYWLIFPTFMFNIFPAPINGTHLWYLPMIFLCMIVISLHTYCRRYALPLVILIYCAMHYYNNLLPNRTLEEFFYYFPIFYSGYLLNKYSVVERLQNTKYRVLSLIISFFACVYFRKHGFPIYGWAVYYGLAALTLYMATSLLLNNKTLDKFSMIITNNSFAIYLLHQFVINALLLFNYSNVNVYLIVCLISLTAFFIPLTLSYLYSSLRFRKI